ncbi:MAG TPA: flagellin [Bryobacteraceae bacterium]|jgi:flagellin|nr:flagellin [Bryobacteraceae bacterium]
MSSISFQTNFASLVAQNNLSMNTQFQTNTIEQLTSGYRINQSGADPAGLAVANQYAGGIAQLTQGVLNANNGLSALQIADGGLSNISSMLDRLQTLATESASTTFTGNRADINSEYQALLKNISQEASNIGMNAGGTYNTVNTVYIGGGTTANSQVSIDLSGTGNQVDSAGLNIANTSVLGGGTELSGNSVRLDAPGATFLNGATQTFSFNLIHNNAATTITATVDGTAGALSQSQVLSSLNSQLSQYGISTQVDANGQLNFGGAAAFTVKTSTTDTTDQIATDTSNATNNGVYSTAGAASYTGKIESLTFQNGGGTASVSLVAADTLATALSKINAQTSTLGIYAVANAAGTGISFQSASGFTASTTAATGTFTAAGAQTITPPTTSATATGNAQAAITAITNAISQLGTVQARIGAGENTLQYATDLANSQITNFSAAEGRIRDANVATEAANLSKAQVLQQSSIAAMAQANSAPQALLKLLG